MIIEKINRTAQQLPEKTAIIYEDQWINYAQLKEIINKLTNGLKGSGIKKGDRVALMLPNVPHFVFSYFALMQLGAIVVPINYMLYEDDLNFVLNNAELKAIIYWENFRKELKNFFQNCADSVFKIVLGKQKANDPFQLTELMSRFPATEMDWDVAPGDVALLQYTSGIADVPVAVELTHENLTENISMYINYFKLTGNDIFGAFLPLFLITNQNEILNAAVSLGAPLVLYSKFDISSTAKSIDSNKISVVSATPNFFRMLIEFEDETFSGSSLKICISSHGNLSDELAEKFYEKFNISLLNSYSITETGGIIAAIHPSFEKLSGSVGLAFSGIELQIHDSFGEPLQNDKIGEIAVRTKYLFEKYWHNDELSEKRLKNGWFYPGDFGKKNFDGYITLIETKINIIVKGGFQIHTTEIEMLLAAHPKVRTTAIISQPYPEHKEDVLACVVLKENESMTEQEIKEFCRQHIPVYKCPQAVKFFDELPRTKMGKIFKRKLQQQI